MPLIKFQHGGNEHTFTGEGALNDLAQFVCKELFGESLSELAQKLFPFKFAMDDIECYFTPQLIARALAPEVMKADVDNLMEDLELLTERYGFDKCPDCNVVYPNQKVERCKRCGYTPPELAEFKMKAFGGALGREEEEVLDAEPSGEGLPTQDASPEDGVQGSASVPEPGGVDRSKLEAEGPSPDTETRPS
jgi:hypothetical protein